MGNRSFKNLTDLDIEEALMSYHILIAMLSGAPIEIMCEDETSFHEIVARINNKVNFLLQVMVN